MFDEQPDGDPHGECAAEIHRLTVELTALRAERDALLNASVPDIARMFDRARTDCATLVAENAALRARVGEGHTDAVRYRLLRNHIEPKILHDKLVRSGEWPGDWRDLLSAQNIAEKIDELCDSAKSVKSVQRGDVIRRAPSPS